MDKSDSLLLSLRKYRPREGRDSLEDFITEAFAWLLRQCPEFGNMCLEDIYSQLESERPAGIDPHGLHWETQVTLNGKRPDMVCHVGDEVLVFEHKATAPLSGRQLGQYREIAEDLWRKRTWIVTITGYRCVDQKEADIRLCWEDIHRQIECFLGAESIPENLGFHLRDFQRLLESEGLGPTEPVKSSSVRCYRTGVALEDQLKSLFMSLLDREWKIPKGYEVYYRHRDGRLGLQFHRSEQDNHWTPGIFAGCMLDGSDHCLGDRAGDLVDFRIILDFSSKLHNRYTEMAAYNSINEALDESVNGTPWTFYDHLAGPGPHNKWHPIHLERSFLELIQGASDPDTQRERVEKGISDGLKCFRENGLLEQLMNECDAMIGEK